MKKYDINDTIILNKDLLNYDLFKGDIGVIIFIHENPNEAYEIEFCDEKGKTIKQVVILKEYFESYDQ
jgi:Domain of unknown function (DUF4926)